MFCDVTIEQGEQKSRVNYDTTSLTNSVRFLLYLMTSVTILEHSREMNSFMKP